MSRTALLPLLALLSTTPVSGGCVACDCLTDGAFLDFVDPDGATVTVDSYELLLDGVSLETSDCEGQGCEVVSRAWAGAAEEGMTLEVRYTIGETTGSEQFPVEKAGGCCRGLYVIEDVVVE